ncbi:MAG: phosphatase PAP2 family protein [Actinomycetota bacterium]|nr:phosphatase PAP2 family protein [Actinomycetota bacterium]
MSRSRAFLLAAGVVSLGALTGAVLQDGPIRRLDWWLHQQIDPHLHGGPARIAVIALSLTGQRGLVALPLLVLAGLTARRQRSLRPVLVALGALVGTAILVLVFKAAVGRVAPGTGHDGVHADGSSYPSGHAINAVVGWGLVLEFAASLNERARRALSRRRGRLITAALAALAGLSMLALDYHWLSDVVAGWLLGAVLLGIVLALNPVSRPAPPG